MKEEYGKGFDSRNLYYFLNFYKTFPNILNTSCSKSNGLLSWSHYRILLQVFDKESREWYENDNIKFMELKPINAVCIYHKGSYNNLRDSYNTILKYI